MSDAKKIVKTAVSSAVSSNTSHLSDGKTIELESGETVRWEKPDSFKDYELKCVDSDEATLNPEELVAVYKMKPKMSRQMLCGLRSMIYTDLLLNKDLLAARLKELVMKSRALLVTSPDRKTTVVYFDSFRIVCGAHAKSLSELRNLASQDEPIGELLKHLENGQTVVCTLERGSIVTYVDRIGDAGYLFTRSEMLM